MTVEGVLKILLVDDDEVDRLAVARALKTAKLEATLEEVCDVAEAAAVLKGRSFDCVLLDYQLPAGDGFDVLRTIRQADLDTPVVILTGHGDEQTAVELMKAGASDYLLKDGLSGDRLAQSLRYAMERRQLEKERDELLVREREAREEAQRANAEKDQFLAVVSHELRTPLNAIQGWASMLSSGTVDDPKRISHGLAVIARNARLQAQLINDLLDTSRFIAGKLELQTGSVELSDVCDAVLDALKQQLETKKIEVERRIDTQIGPIPCDVTRVQQVISNLISNAIKFSAIGGVIRLDVRRADASNVEIIVADRGVGIHPDFLPRIFERFSQARSGSQGGLGLGLAIARHLIELHGGSIRAESAGEGQGATFTVVLPAESSVSSPQERRQRTVPEARLNGIRVLYVDDNADARELVEGILVARGARVSTYDSKDAALLSLERNRPDVLISDIEMPDGDGFELIQALRLREEDDGARIPAIALTGKTNTEDRIRMLSAGFQIHVPKPIDSAELIAAVASLSRKERRRGAKRPLQSPVTRK